MSGTQYRGGPLPPQIQCLLGYIVYLVMRLKSCDLFKLLLPTTKQVYLKQPKVNEFLKKILKGLHYHRHQQMFSVKDQIVNI